MTDVLPDSYFDQTLKVLESYYLVYFDLENYSTKFYISQILSDKQLYIRYGKGSQKGTISINKNTDKFQKNFQLKTGIDYSKRHKFKPLFGKYSFVPDKILRNEVKIDEKEEFCFFLKCLIGNSPSFMSSCNSQQTVTDLNFPEIYSILNRMETIILNPNEANEKKVDAYPYIFKIMELLEFKLKPELDSLNAKYYGYILPLSLSSSSSSVSPTGDTDEEEEDNLTYKKINTISMVNIERDKIKDIENYSNNLKIKDIIKSSKDVYSHIGFELTKVSEKSKKIISDFYYNCLSLINKTPYKIKDIIEIVNPKIKFTDEDDTMFLVHGSAFSNWVSIVKNGFLIPNHPGMFGRGIYFANSATKSIGYCKGGSGDNVCLALCRVKLGKKMLKTKNAMSNLTPESVKKQGISSVKGCGRFTPSLHSSFQDSLIPTGKLIEKDKNRVLYHDEYIVYDPNLVEIRYLLFLGY